MGEALAYLAAGVTAAWGVAHIMPTGRVVAGFGSLSRDNRLILTMDWVAEGFTLVLLGCWWRSSRCGRVGGPGDPGRVRGRGGCAAGVRGVDGGHRRSGFGHLLQQPTTLAKPDIPLLAGTLPTEEPAFGPSGA
jgi:hypothetical protein